jgi:hypothetical protein
VPNTEPCRGRNCGKNENAKTAAFGVGRDRHQRRAERGGRGTSGGRTHDGQGRAELLVAGAAGAAPGGDPEVDEHDAAHDVQGQVQPPGGAQQRGQASRNAGSTDTTYRTVSLIR